jgi:hypothetical protein
MSEVAVSPGDSVERGAVLGLVGGTGIALGPHLHLEVRTAERNYGATLNPALFLEMLPETGIVIGRLLDDRGQLSGRGHVSLHRVVDGQVQWVASTTTYPADPVNSTSEWGENFVFSDLPEGSYVVVATDQPVQVEDAVEVRAGSAAHVVVRR